MVQNKIREVSNGQMMSFVNQDKKFSFGTIKHLFRILNNAPGKEEYSKIGENGNSDLY